jgi:hypothetical protein
MNNGLMMKVVVMENDNLNDCHYVNCDDCYYNDRDHDHDHPRDHVHDPDLLNVDFVVYIV